MGPGYNFIQGIGGPGIQQAGPMMFSQQQQQPMAPAQTPMNPLATGAYTSNPILPSNGSAGPAQQSALQNNAINVPGFGYISNDWLSGGNTLNGLGAPSFTSAQIAAINKALGGQSFGYNQGTGAGTGAYENYGFNQGAKGASALGDSYTVGGQNYSPDQLQGAIDSFNKLLMSQPDYKLSNGKTLDSTLGPDWFHQDAKGISQNGYSNLGQIYNYLQTQPLNLNGPWSATDPHFSMNGQGYNQNGPNPFAAYYNDPTMKIQNGTLQTAYNGASGVQK